MPNYQADLDHAFRALADPTRRAVLQQLAAGPASVKELAAPFDMALPSFLQHLDILETSGLVTSKKTGRVRMCAMQPVALDPVEEWIRERKAVWEGRFDRMDTYLTDMKEKDAGE